jgi:iron complex transport system ATP-binding protein
MPTSLPQPDRIEARAIDMTIDGARLLEAVSLAAKGGELVGLIGPNGSGKSTLLRTMAAIARPTGGVVLLEGRALPGMGAREAAKTLAFVAQHAPDTHGFTGLEIVLTGRYPHLGRFAVEGAKDRSIAHDAMARTDTAEFGERIVATLSGGERQRLFLARGLAQQPRILLLDEPTASLDVAHQLAIFALLRELAAEGLTIVTAIHDLRMAARFCDRLVLLSHGRVLADGAPETVLSTANLAAAFHIAATVFRDPLTGRLAVDFDSHEPHGAVGGGQRVHVVCGGGSGLTVLRTLVRSGYEVTAGPLGAGDIDRVACEALGVPYLATPGFAPIDDATHAAHLDLIAAADCVVVGEMPFGAGNLRNLDALRAATTLVVIESEPFARRDYTDGVASRAWAALRIDARSTTTDDLVAAITAALATAERSSEEVAP